MKQRFHICLITEPTFGSKLAGACLFLWREADGGCFACPREWSLTQPVDPALSFCNLKALSESFGVSIPPISNSTRVMTFVL